MERISQSIANAWLRRRGSAESREQGAKCFPCEDRAAFGAGTGERPAGGYSALKSLLLTLPLLRWSALTGAAIGGSLLYGATLSLVLRDWSAAAAALWLAVSAGLAWCVLIPALCRFARVRLVDCIDACLVTMACGEIILSLGAGINAMLWWTRAVAHGAVLNMGIVAISNVTMALVLVLRLRPHGVSASRVWSIWMAALNGSGAVFFLLFHQWLHRA